MVTKFTSQEEAERFFSEFYLGKQHIPRSGIEPFGTGWCIYQATDLSTFDPDGLTRLVFLAHDMCFRVSVQPGGLRRIRIAVWKRTGRIGRISERHPTITAALEVWEKLTKRR